jgi:hypothetical protein
MYLHHTVHSYTLIRLALSIIHMLQAVQGSKYQMSYKYSAVMQPPCVVGM